MNQNNIDKLYNFCMSGQISHVKLLLDVKKIIKNIKNFNIIDDKKSYVIYRALCLACQFGHIEIMQYLLSKFSIITIDTCQYYLLQLACVYHHDNIVEYLVKFIKKCEYRENIDMVYWYLCRFNYENLIHIISSTRDANHIIFNLHMVKKIEYYKVINPDLLKYLTLEEHEWLSNNIVI